MFISFGLLDKHRGSFDCALSARAQDEAIFLMPSTMLPHPERERSEQSKGAGCLCGAKVMCPQPAHKGREVF
jgi:hypothetical protein